MLRRFTHYLHLILPLVGGMIIFYGCIEILTRVVFEFQHMWINDLLLLVMVSILWLASIYVVMNKRETSINVVVNRLHGRTKVSYQLILDIISCTGCLLLGFSGLELVRSLVKLELEISTVLPIPQFVPVLCFAIAMLGCSSVFVIRVVKSIKRLR